MMLLYEILTAILVAVVLVSIFGMLLGRRGPWDGLGWFFLVVFLGAWAIGTWSAPIGPTAFGIAWVPFFFGALVLALLLAAASEPPRRPVTEAETVGDAVAIGVFFWVLLLVLVMVIVAGFTAAA